MDVSLNSVLQNTRQYFQGIPSGPSTGVRDHHPSSEVVRRYENSPPVLSAPETNNAGTTAAITVSSISVFSHYHQQKVIQPSGTWPPPSGIGPPPPAVPIHQSPNYYTPRSSASSSSNDSPSGVRYFSSNTSSRELSPKSSGHVTENSASFIAYKSDKSAFKKAPPPAVEIYPSHQPLQFRGAHGMDDQQNIQQQPTIISQQKIQLEHQIIPHAGQTYGAPTTVTRFKTNREFEYGMYNMDSIVSQPNNNNNQSSRKSKIKSINPAANNTTTYKPASHYQQQENPNNRRILAQSSSNSSPVQLPYHGQQQIIKPQPFSAPPQSQRESPAAATHSCPSIQMQMEQRITTFQYQATYHPAAGNPNSVEQQDNSSRNSRLTGIETHENTNRIESYPKIEFITKRESPLDLSTKTVRQSADSTGAMDDPDNNNNNNNNATFNNGGNHSKYIDNRNDNNLLFASRPFEIRQSSSRPSQLPSTYICRIPGDSSRVQPQSSLSKYNRGGLPYHSESTTTAKSTTDKKLLSNALSASSFNNERIPSTSYKNRTVPQESDQQPLAFQQFNDRKRPSTTDGAEPVRAKVCKFPSWRQTIEKEIDNRLNSYTMQKAKEQEKRVGGKVEEPDDKINSVPRSSNSHLECNGGGGSSGNNNSSQLDSRDILNILRSNLEIKEKALFQKQQQLQQQQQMEKQRQQQKQQLYSNQPPFAHAHQLSHDQFQVKFNRNKPAPHIHHQPSLPTPPRYEAKGIEYQQQQQQQQQQPMQQIPFQYLPSSVGGPKSTDLVVDKSSPGNYYYGPKKSEVSKNYEYQNSCKNREGYSSPLPPFQAIPKKFSFADQQDHHRNNIPQVRNYNNYEKKDNAAILRYSPIISAVLSADFQTAEKIIRGETTPIQPPIIPPIVPSNVSSSSSSSSLTISPSISAASSSSMPPRLFRTKAELKQVTPVDNSDRFTTSEKSMYTFPSYSGIQARSSIRSAPPVHVDITADSPYKPAQLTTRLSTHLDNKDDSDNESTSGKLVIVEDADEIAEINSVENKNNKDVDKVNANPPQVPEIRSILHPRKRLFSRSEDDNGKQNNGEVKVFDFRGSESESEIVTNAVGLVMINSEKIKEQKEKQSISTGPVLNWTEFETKYEYLADSDEEWKIACDKLVQQLSNAAVNGPKKRGRKKKIQTEEPSVIQPLSSQPEIKIRRKYTKRKKVVDEKLLLDISKNEIIDSNSHDNRLPSAPIPSLVDIKPEILSSSDDSSIPDKKNFKMKIKRKRKPKTTGQETNKIKPQPQDNYDGDNSDSADTDTESTKNSVVGSSKDLIKESIKNIDDDNSIKNTVKDLEENNDLESMDVKLDLNSSIDEEFNVSNNIDDSIIRESRSKRSNIGTTRLRIQNYLEFCTDSDDDIDSLKKSKSNNNKDSSDTDDSTVKRYKKKIDKLNNNQAIKKQMKSEENNKTSDEENDSSDDEDDDKKEKDDISIIDSDKTEKKNQLQTRKKPFGGKLEETKSKTNNLQNLRKRLISSNSSQGSSGGKKRKIEKCGNKIIGKNIKNNNNSIKNLRNLRGVRRQLRNIRTRSSGKICNSKQNIIGKLKKNLKSSDGEKYISDKSVRKNNEKNKQQPMRIMPDRIKSGEKVKIEESIPNNKKLPDKAVVGAGSSVDKVKSSEKNKITDKGTKSLEKNKTDKIEDKITKTPDKEKPKNLSKIDKKSPENDKKSTENDKKTPEKISKTAANKVDVEEPKSKDKLINNTKADRNGRIEKFMSHKRNLRSRDIIISGRSNTRKCRLIASSKLENKNNKNFRERGFADKSKNSLDNTNSKNFAQVKPKNCITEKSKNSQSSGKKKVKEKPGETDNDDDVDDEEEVDGGVGGGNGDCKNNKHQISWEEELFNYKYSLRMPLKLINISKPANWPRSGNASSLPDLERIKPNLLITNKFSRASDLLPEPKDTKSENCVKKKELQEEEGMESLKEKLKSSIKTEPKSPSSDFDEKFENDDISILQESSKRVANFLENKMKLMENNGDRKKFRVNGRDIKGLLNDPFVGFFRNETLEEYKEVFQKHNEKILKNCILVADTAESTTGLKKNGILDKNKNLKTDISSTGIYEQTDIKEEEYEEGHDRPASAPPDTNFNRLVKKKTINNGGNVKPVLKDFARFRNRLLQKRRLEDYFRSGLGGKNFDSEKVVDSASKLEDFLKTSYGQLNNTIVRRKKKARTIRRKCRSSGFDYIRKKKKTQQKLSLDDEEIKEKKRKVIMKASRETVEDIENEIKSWAVNKGIGETILHKAARLGYSDITIYCLEKLDFSPLTVDNAGYTPLHEACTRGHINIAKILLMYGADVSASAKGGIRPLHEAIEYGDIELVRLLLSYGADPLLATYSGLTPLTLVKDDQDDVRDFLLSYLDDIRGNENTAWPFLGYNTSNDEYNSGYDPLADAPSLKYPELGDLEIEFTDSPLPALYWFSNDTDTDLWVICSDLPVNIQATLHKCLSEKVPRFIERNISRLYFDENVNCVCFMENNPPLINNNKINSSLISLIKYDDNLKTLLKIQKTVLPT